MVFGTGVRYVVSLYRLKDGELLAVLDGKRITDLRTGAASGVLARRVPLEQPVTVGLLGAGHQSRMQLECLASVYAVESAAVFSPTAANRETFAREMTARLGFPVTAARSAEAAVRGHAGGSGRNQLAQQRAGVAGSMARPLPAVVRGRQHPAGIGGIGCAVLPRCQPCGGGFAARRRRSRRSAAGSEKRRARPKAGRRRWPKSSAAALPCRARA